MKGCYCDNEKLRNLGFLVLRISVGIIFILSGLDKFNHIESTIEMFSIWGFPFPSLMFYIIATIQLLGGIAIILGLMTQFFAPLLSIIMAVAILVVHLGKNPFRDWQFAFILFGVSLALTFIGAGKWVISDKQCLCQFMNKEKKSEEE